MVTSVGQTVTPLAPVGLLAPRRWNQGPQRVPVNRTAEQAQVGASAMAAGWVLEVVGPRPYTLTLADLEPRAVHQARFPINCVEGWSVGADRRGLSLLEIVQQAGGTADSRVQVVSLEPVGYNRSFVEGPQVSTALLATHLNDGGWILTTATRCDCRPEPRRCAEHQMAQPDRDRVMKAWRIALAIAGLLLELSGSSDCSPRFQLGA